MHIASLRRDYFFTLLSRSKTTRIAKNCWLLHDKYNVIRLMLWTHTDLLYCVIE
jgi:hypothetical protein